MTEPTVPSATEPAEAPAGSPMPATPLSETTLPPEPPKDASVDEIEQDIAVTRERLGETIDALEDKLDVSAQAKRKVDATRAQVADRVAQTRAQVTDKIEQTKAQATGKVTQLTERVGQARDQVTSKITQGRSQPQDQSSVQWRPRSRVNPDDAALPAAVVLALAAGLIVWRQLRARRPS